MKDLPNDLKQVNEVLQDISTKLMNIRGRMDETFRVDGQAIDSFEKLSKTLSDRVKKEKELQKLLRHQRVEVNQTMAAQDKASKKRVKAEEKLDKLLDQQQKYHKKTGIASARLKGLAEEQWKKTEKLVNAEQAIHLKLEQQNDSMRSMEVEQEKVKKKWDVIGAYVGNKVLGAVDAIGKSLAAFALDALVSGVGLLKAGFLKVFDLIERQTKATGEFNEQLGAGTKNLRELQKEGWELEGALRSIDDAELGVGLKELAAATQSFGFADKNLKEFRKDAVLAGRALGIGVDAAGELARTWHLMAGDKPASMFVDIQDAANSANVPVAKFAKEVSASRLFMASFGKAGEKAFLRTAAFAAKLGVSLQSLQGFTEITDTFEGAAEAAAKLNATFGTSVNALDLMLEEDPGKRLEMVRKQMLAQGRDVENMSRREVKYLAQTIGLNEEEVEAVMKKGVSLDQFYASEKKRKAGQVKDEETLRKGLLATVKTLEPWKMLFDQLTTAFMPFVKQFTDFLGITHSKGSKDMESFASKVSRVKDNVVALFDTIQKNPKVKAFVDRVFGSFKGIFDLISGKGGDTKKLIKDIADAAGSVAELAGKMFDVMKTGFDAVWKNRDALMSVFKFLVDNAGTILAIWGGVKVGGGLIGAAGGVGKIVDMTATFGSALQKASLALSGGGVGLAGMGFAAAVGIAAYALTKFALDNTELGKKINKGTQDFFAEQGSTLTKLMTVFSKEARDEEIKKGEGEVNYVLAKAGSPVRVGEQAIQQPAAVHLAPPPQAATSGETNLAKKKTAPAKKGVVVHNTIKLDGKKLGSAVSEVQLDAAAQ